MIEGYWHACALDPGDIATCLGDGSTVTSSPPTTPFVQISAGWSHTCGLAAGGHIECWGSDSGWTD